MISVIYSNRNRKKVFKIYFERHMPKKTEYNQVTILHNFGLAMSLYSRKGSTAGLNDHFGSITRGALWSQ